MSDSLLVLITLLIGCVLGFFGAGALALVWYAGDASRPALVFRAIIESWSKRTGIKKLVLIDDEERVVHVELETLCLGLETAFTLDMQEQQRKHANAGITGGK